MLLLNSNFYISSFIEINMEELSLQELVIGYAILNGDCTAATSYKTKDGIRYHNKTLKSNSELGNLIKTFRDNPFKAISDSISTIEEIKRDSASNDNRIIRYFEAYQDLLMKLDRVSFQRSESNVFSGIPSYIPDGFSDMGSDSELDSKYRNREKQYISKKDFFKNSKRFLDSIVIDDEKIKSSGTIKKVVQHVQDKMPYDYVNNGSSFLGESVNMVDIVEGNKAVCRHQALYATVLLQTLGFNATLLKNHVDFTEGKFGSHVATLIKGQDSYFLLDVTNPVFKYNGKDELTLVKLPEKDIDVNKKQYTWSIPTDKGNWIYKSRNNMFYRLKENY